jgi:hypothetical protein
MSRKSEGSRLQRETVADGGDDFVHTKKRRKRGPGRQKDEFSFDDVVSIFFGSEREVI